MLNLIRSVPACLLAVLVFMPMTAVAADKPNIVLVVMDNFGWGEIGVYGGGVMRGAPTPNIDSIAEKGMLLTDYYAQPSCTAGRSRIRFSQPQVSGASSALRNSGCNLSTPATIEKLFRSASE